MSSRGWPSTTTTCPHVDEPRPGCFSAAAMAIFSFFFFFFSWKHPQVIISQHAPFSLAVATSQCEASVSIRQSLPAVGLSKLRNGIRKLPCQIFDLTESPGAVGWALKLFYPHSPMWDSDRRLSHPTAPVGTKPLQPGTNHR